MGHGVAAPGAPSFAPGEELGRAVGQTQGPRTPPDAEIRRHERVGVPQCAHGDVFRRPRPDTRQPHERTAQLDEYFAGERTDFDVRMELDGTDFQRQVWSELTRIPYGETISYGEVARRGGRPSAPRAVGQANGRNPIPVIVPCHRVVASDGIGGYGGGLNVKRKLLAVEGVTA